MDTDLKILIIRTDKTEWKPSTEEGIETTGIFVKSLRYDEKTKRSPSILLKFEPGSGYPFHNHPAGEEIFVLKGSCLINDTLLNAGDYLYTPPGFKHSVRTNAGCEIMAIVPEEVEILKK